MNINYILFEIYVMFEAGFVYEMFDKVENITIMD